jgi:hypothetical protein
MKKAIVLLVVGTVFVLAGCADLMPVHYGQAATPEPGVELCTLIVDSGLKILGYDWNSEPVLEVSSILQIPAGTHILVFDYESTSKSRTSVDYQTSRITTTTTSAKGITVTHEFQPGKKYYANAVVNAQAKTIAVEISETSLPMMAGARLGLFPGWLNGFNNLPISGLFVDLETGFTTTGNTPVEFMIESNAGFGYSPFDETWSYNLQGGGTANIYFGKSRKKTGFGLGGGVSRGMDWSTWNPYARLSFFPYTKLFYLRLFADYSFTEEDMLKRFGLGIQFFPKGRSFP